MKPDWREKEEKSGRHSAEEQEEKALYVQTGILIVIICLLCAGIILYQVFQPVVFTIENSLPSETQQEEEPQESISSVPESTVSSESAVSSESTASSENAASSESTLSSESTASSESPSSTPESIPSEGKINLNTASAKELESLPAIGEARARAIIEYREREGPFQTVEEVMEVKGIGEKTYEAIRDLVTV